MRRWTPSPTVLAAAVAALAVCGTLLAAQATARSSSAGYAACVDSKGELKLLSSKHTCGSGRHKVTVGKRGPTGANGSKGATGSTGATGPAGVQGPVGAAGADGRTVLSGAGAPTFLLGSTGDFYLDTSDDTLYGPAVRSCSLLCHTSWGMPTSLVGPAGAQGATGATGATGAPGSADIGMNESRSTGVSSLGDGDTQLLYLPVHSGHRYLFQSAGTVGSTGAAVVPCALKLTTGAGTDTLATSVTSVSQSSQAFALTAIVAPAHAGSVLLTCRTTGVAADVSAATMTELDEPS